LSRLPSVKIENVSYSPNGSRILSDISFEASGGEFVGLIGPNGAGKTTLLKCINGLIKPDEGKVYIAGMPIDKLDSRSIARKVSLMHQRTEISFPFPSIEVVLAGRYPYLGRLEKEGRRDYEIARNYMSLTDTLKFEKRPVNQISGGERQRVLYAKLLAQETDIVLLDEPTANLDILFEEQVFEHSREMCRNGKTVIAAVHDLKTAARFCSRLILMKSGRIVADGTPENVLTSENISKTFGVKALVYRNRISGNLDFHIYGTGRSSIIKSNRETERPKNIHIIGGGGSAAGVIRFFYENGCNMTAGVFAHGDSDITSAEVFGVECIVGKPFSEISDEDFNRNVEMIKKADIVVLCEMPFGYQNLRNLDAAEYSKKLVLIEEGPPESRDFTGGIAFEKYSRLREKAIIINNSNLHEIL